VPLMRSPVVAVLTMLLLSPALVACDNGSPLALGEGAEEGAGEGVGEGAGEGAVGGASVPAPPRDTGCRLLDVAAISSKSDDTETVDCTDDHNAETFHVGTFSDAEDLERDDPGLGAQVYQQCHRRFMRYVGATPSLALRSVIDWAWWRPDQEEWDEGARWFRCDVVGGDEQSTELVKLPRTAKGLLLGIPEAKWMLCADGPVVAEAPKVPCSEPHTWRAVSAVVLGKPKDKWPGARVVEVNTRDYCSDWVGAWLNYPLDYEFGYTWFGKAEWQAGNRQSVCWAKNDE
jgi:hypothetical protein